MAAHSTPFCPACLFHLIKARDVAFPQLVTPRAAFQYQLLLSVCCPELSGSLCPQPGKVACERMQGHCNPGSGLPDHKRPRRSTDSKNALPALLPVLLDRVLVTSRQCGRELRGRGLVFSSSISTRLCRTFDCGRLNPQVFISFNTQRYFFLFC